MKRLSNFGNSNNQTPPDGLNFDSPSISTTSLTELSPSGSAIARPAGLLNGSVVGVLTNFTGAAGTNVKMVLEGSHDGSSAWWVLAQSSNTQSFTANGTKVLNEEFGGVVDFERYRYFRIRAVSTATTFSLTVTIVGRSLSGAQTNYVSESLTRTGATVNATSFIRPPTGMVTNAYIVCSASAGGGTLVANLQGSYDGGTTFVTIASSVGDAASGAFNAQLFQDGSALINLAGYSHFRFQITDSGASTFTILAYAGFESCDVRAGLYGTTSNDEIDNLMECSVVGTASGETADQMTLTFQVLKKDGSPLLAARNILLVLSDTLNAGMEDLSTNGTFVSASVGTIVVGAATNKIVITTAAATGQAVVLIGDAFAETIYAMGFSDGVPNVDRFAVVSSQQVVCTFS